MEDCAAAKVSQKRERRHRASRSHPRKRRSILSSARMHSLERKILASLFALSLDRKQKERERE